MAATNKQFLHPHPTDPAKEVHFVCLEGNENGVYFRGKQRLIDGVAIIPIPQEWTLVHAIGPEDVTVHLTPIRAFANLAVWDVSEHGIVVRGTEDCAFSYLVMGVRRGFEHHEAVSENFAFRPEVAGIPFGPQYQKAFRDLLVSNGILNRDYTPSEATAARLGWTLRSPTAQELASADRAERAWRARHGLDPAQTAR